VQTGQVTFRWADHEETYGAPVAKPRERPLADDDASGRRAHQCARGEPHVIRARYEASGPAGVTISVAQALSWCVPGVHDVLSVE